MAFVAALAALSVSYGVFAARWDWFPSPIFSSAETTVREIRKNWRNDLGLEPTRHLVRGRDREGLVDGYAHRAGTPTPGYVLVSGLSPDQDVSFHAVTLYDEAGRRLHRWPVHYDRLHPEGHDPENVMIHGMEVFPDGSLAVTFDAGGAMARIDACGDALWVTEAAYHHALTLDDEGRIWAWRNEVIEALDAETGRVLSALSVHDDIVPAGGGQEGIFAIRSVMPVADDKPDIDWGYDAFHTNDVEPLLPKMAAAFPQFETGDLLISMRELNLVAVLAPGDGRVKWYRHGPWHRQHDPDFQPDGTISVFDNRTHSAASRILSVDPGSGAVETLFAHHAAAPFYTWRRGKHQILPGGHILVTEAEHGRVFEVTAGGELVWEREMIWDEERNLIVTEARHVGPDFFAAGLPRCAEGQAGLAR